MNSNESIVVDLSSLVGYVILKCKWIILFACIGILLGIAGNAYLSSKYAVYFDKLDADIEQERNKLTQVQLEEVDKIFNQYQVKVSIRNQLHDYVNNSAFMGLDYSNLPRYDAYYLVETGQSRLIDILRGILALPEVMDHIGKIYGYADTNVYYMDLVSITYTSEIDRQDIEITDGDIRSGNLDDVYSGLLKISAYGEEDVSAAVSDYLESLVTDKVAQLTEQDERITIRKVDSSFKVDIDNNVRTTQSAKLSELAALTKEINTFDNDSNSAQGNQLAGLDSDQKEYFALLKAKFTNEQPERVHKLRNLALGAIVGVFIGLAVVILKYLLSDKIQTPYYTNHIKRSLLKLRLRSTRRNVFSRAAQAVFGCADIDAETTKEKISSFALLVSELISRNEWKSVYIVKEETENGALKKLHNMLNEKIEEVFSGTDYKAQFGNPYADSVEFDKMINSDAVIFEVVINETLKKKINYLYDACSNIDVPVAGAYYEQVI